MKKSFLLTLPLLLSLFSVTGCNSNEGKISLYDGDSRFVIESFTDTGSIPLPTYRNSKTGEVPYANLADFFYVNSGLGTHKPVVKKDGNNYKVFQDDGTTLLTVDPEKDIFTVENYESWGGLINVNNKVGPDLASPDVSDDGAVHASDKTKYVTEKKPEVYNLKKYNIDAISQDDKCFLPTQFLANFFYRWNGSDVLYNGMDFYLSAGLMNNMLPVLNQSYFANKLTFQALEGVDATSTTPLNDEAYRFVFPVKKDDKTIYRFLSLTNDGKGKILEGLHPTDAGEKVENQQVTYSYTWKKTANSILVDTFATGKDEQGNEQTVSRGTAKIPLRETFYATKTRPQAIIDFSYDLLRFQFDNFYGLKDVLNYTSFEDYLAKNNLSDKIKSADSAVYDEAVAQLMNKNVDDGHTRYSLPSIFTGKSQSHADELAKKYIGTRYQTLLDKRTEYLTLRKNTLHLENENDGVGYFTSGNTAVIRFDLFINLGTWITNVYEKDEAENTDPGVAFKNSDIALGFDASFARIKKNNSIKNVVIDVTCNGGGQVSLLPYIIAHFSNDPTITIKDVAMGVVKEFHYSVDLNHDKVYGGEGDTYQGKYNFYVLTSDFSFSCANFLAMTAKSSNIKIIGKKSGGGACPVGAFSDGSGSLYNFSSPQVAVLKKDNEYDHTDAGVDVDYELDSSSWYDLAKLDTFLNNLQNK